jgi:hypothetical protein
MGVMALVDIRRLIDAQGCGRDVVAMLVDALPADVSADGLSRTFAILLSTGVLDTLQATQLRSAFDRWSADDDDVTRHLRTRVDAAETRLDERRTAAGVSDLIEQNRSLRNALAEQQEQNRSLQHAIGEHREAAAAAQAVLREATT